MEGIARLQRVGGKTHEIPSRRAHPDPAEDRAVARAASGEAPGAAVTRIELDDVSRPQVLALLEEHLRNMHEVTPPDQVFAFDADRIRAPGVALWSAWEEHVLLGCAALQEISPTQGEVKSMRTPAGLRGRGAGRALLDHILRVSRQRGYRQLFLETGSHPAFMPARTLYRSVGFRECGPFGAYEENGFSVFMSLHLGDDPQ